MVDVSSIIILLIVAGVIILSVGSCVTLYLLCRYVWGWFKNACEKNEKKQYSKVVITDLDTGKDFELGDDKVVNNNVIFEKKGEEVVEEEETKVIDEYVVVDLDTTNKEGR